MDPTSQIAIIETDLRRVIQAVLGGTAQQNWLQDHVAPEALETLIARRGEEAKRRAPASVPQSPLAYMHFYEIRRIIEKNWDQFAPVLGQKKEFAVLADIVEDFRNAPAHSRELLPHEIAMLQGIAGTIRTQVTTFLSTTSPDRTHYPVIEWARDSFGNELAGEFDSQAGVNTDIRLEIGQQVTFDLRGWDPQGRDLSWTCVTIPHDPREFRRSPVMKGTEVTWAWEALPEHVSAHTMVEFSLNSSGPYHRHQGYDARVLFTYAVDPPDVHG